ncbi:hypothetical protein [Saccharothrix stipae]
MGDDTFSVETYILDDASTLRLADVLSVNRNDNCRFLRGLRDYEHREVKRYNILMYLLAVVLVAVLSGLIVATFFTNDRNWVEVGVSLLGTIASGTAVAWIAKQRNEHQKLMNKYTRAVDAACSSAG